MGLQPRKQAETFSTEQGQQVWNFTHEGHFLLNVSPPPQIKSEREFNAEWGLVKYFNIEFYLDIFTCLWTGSVL